MTISGHKIIDRAFEFLSYDEIQEIFKALDANDPKFWSNNLPFMIETAIVCKILNKLKAINLYWIT